MQIKCNTSGAYHLQHAVCYVVRRDQSNTEFDRAETAFIFCSISSAETVNRLHLSFRMFIVSEVLYSRMFVFIDVCIPVCLYYTVFIFRDIMFVGLFECVYTASCVYSRTFIFLCIYIQGRLNSMMYTVMSFKYVCFS